MTDDVADAIRILYDLMQEVLPKITGATSEQYRGHQLLSHAIRHLAYPDRDVYPKTRRGTKGAPIVRK